MKCNIQFHRFSTINFITPKIYKKGGHLDDFTGSFCSEGKFPLLSSIKKTFDKLAPPTTPRTTTTTKNPSSTAATLQKSLSSFKKNWLDKKFFFIFSWPILMYQANVILTARERTFCAENP
ncbi:hypothetical protein BpHYR1_024233 [Brachionus plicatilis]|uniref:Uncharacterized protein n=1 Tax=Brachionus plicatilis TaxID=10195 RepID=A0A3M7R8D1_BRAPC|nr:hypothetical protein BpHYR1_024233 [Brachionus plicatilis]